MKKKTTKKTKKKSKKRAQPFSVVCFFSGLLLGLAAHLITGMDEIILNAKKAFANGSKINAPLHSSEKREALSQAQPQNPKQSQGKSGYRATK